MKDTCSGTLTVVAAGHVLVYDRARNRLIKLSKGGRYQARG
jgi:hypothetical protein